MKLVDGVWWLDSEGGPASYARRSEELWDKVIQPFRGPKKVAVQAGGHVGLVPLALGRVFQRVYTFEPEARNFWCLVRNCEGWGHIYPTRGVLGHVHEMVSLAINSKSTGGHNVLKAPGPVPTYRIDDLALDQCEAIFLDVEGTEYWALRGAEQTITRFKPLVVVEENKKAHNKGVTAGDILRFLSQFGYRKIAQVGEDSVYSTGATL